MDTVGTLGTGPEQTLQTSGGAKVSTRRLQVDQDAVAAGSTINATFLGTKIPNTPFTFSVGTSVSPVLVSQNYSRAVLDVDITVPATATATIQIFAIDSAGDIYTIWSSGALAPGSYKFRVYGYLQAALATGATYSAGTGTVSDGTTVAHMSDFRYEPDFETYFTVTTTTVAATGNIALTIKG